MIFYHMAITLKSQVKQNFESVKKDNNKATE